MTSQSNQTKIENIKSNLMAQAERIFSQTNQHSIKTRYRYLAAEERFAGFLAEEYKLQKISNVKARHLIDYVQHLQEKGLSPSTVQTDIAAIRFFHGKTGSKNMLPQNNNLNLQKRQVGKMDRAWTKYEVENAIKLAQSMGRDDVVYAIKMASIYGMRLEEVCKCQTNHLKDGLSNGDLYVKGKNGQVRFIPLRTKEELVLARSLIDFAIKHKRYGTDRVLYDNVRGGTQKAKKSIQNWISNHRYAFEDKSRENNSEQKKYAKDAKKKAIKLKTESITFHGLRHQYAQQQYNKLLASGVPPAKARLIVSERLGHHRAEITKIYLSDI